MNTEKKYCPTCRVWIEDPGTREMHKYAKFWRDNRCDRCGSVLQFPQTPLRQMNTADDSTDRVEVTTTVNANGRTSLFSRLMDGLRRMFVRNAWYKGTDAFVNAALRNRSAECRLGITQFQNAYNSLSEGFKKQGLSGSQITDTLWARLSAICPQCGWHISGEDLGNLRLMGSIGFDRVSVYGPGRALRFGKGNCLNETCSSNEVVLRWEAHPADDLSPFTPNEGDMDALKTYWRKSAIQWWKTQSKIDAICDRCNGTIPRGEGYYSAGIYADLVCERCVIDRLAPDRLQTLYREKSGHARDELRAARQLAGIGT